MVWWYDSRARRWSRTRNVQKAWTGGLKQAWERAAGQRNLNRLLDGKKHLKRGGSHLGAQKDRGKGKNMSSSRGKIYEKEKEEEH